MKHTERMEDLVVAERAAEWLQRLEQGGPEVHAEFGRWLRESPRHVREVLLASAIRHALRNGNSVGPSKVAEIRARFEDSVVEIELALTRSPSVTHGRKPWEQLLSRAARCRNAASRQSWRLASTLAFVALLAFTAIALYAVPDRTITTVAGEWRNVDLDDGSVLRAGPRTKVTVEMTPHRRLIRLAHGELMVHVARDRARPFYVETEFATARAVGTAFAMRLVEPSRASVTVQEGIVAVVRGPAPISDDSSLGSVKVIAGEGLTVTSDVKALVPQPIDVQRDLAWVQQQLVLGANGTISEGIRELNRRNRTQIKLLDSTLGERALRGVFSASDPAAFAETLEHSLRLSVVEENDTLLLVAQPRAESAGSREH
jgi:transmembrane sensor